MSKIMNLVGIEGLVIMVLYTLFPVLAYRFMEFQILKFILMFLVFLLISVCFFAHVERKYMDKGIAFTLCIVPFTYGLIDMIAVETETIWIKAILILGSMVLYFPLYAYMKENFTEVE